MRPLPASIRAGGRPRWAPAARPAAAAMAPTAAGAAAASAAAAATTAKTPEVFARRLLRDLADFCGVMLPRPWKDPSGRGEPAPPGLLAPCGLGDDADVPRGTIADATADRQALLLLADFASAPDQLGVRRLVPQALEAVHEGCCVILVLLFQPGIRSRDDADLASRHFEVALEVGAHQVISDPPWNTTELKVMVEIACNRWRRSTVKSQLTLEMEPNAPEGETAALEATRHNLLFGEVRRQLMQQLPAVNNHLAEDPMSVGGRYNFTREISSGQCRVFEARDANRDGELVAVKVTKKSDIWNMNYFDGLYREYLLLRTKLQHENVVRCREVLHGRACIYHILDYVGGQNLEQLLESRRPTNHLAREEVDSCFEQIASALWHCHERRLSHRSLSPHHVVVSQPGDGGIKCTLVDFRSALSASCGQLGQMQHGKMPFMAPEMMAGLSHHPLRVDCWSLGAVLLEVAAGREALAEALRWDGAAEPTEATAAAAAVALREPGVPARVAARFGAAPSPRALRAAEVLLRPDPEERWDVRSALDAFRAAGPAGAAASAARRGAAACGRASADAAGEVEVLVRAGHEPPELLVG